VQEPYTDLGNARRFITQHGKDLHFVPPWKKWLIWDGTRWAVDQRSEVMGLAKDTIRGLYGELGGIEDPDKRKSFAQHIARSESHSRFVDILKLAESEPGIAVMPDQLDADPRALTVYNGTLELQTGQLRPHRKEDLITKLVPITYDPEAPCPTWDAFLQRILGGDTDLLRYLQKAVGYSLTGSTEEQCLFILYGVGSNGKSTLIQTVQTLLGDYARQTPTESLLVKSGDSVRNDLARLQGARFVAAVESEDGRRLAEALVKQLTGGDRIATRYLYREFFEFVPTFKLWLAVNHKPVIQGTDHAIWRRIRLLPFMVTIPEAEQDKRLSEKLRAELPGILRRAVEGCLAWQQEGFEPPQAVQQATGDYRAEMDVVAAFIRKRCIQGQQKQVGTGELHTEYVGWCTQVGEQPVSQKAFGATLKELGFTQSRNRSTRLWLGLALRMDR
jgi:putative DNA primase/helicase